MLVASSGESKATTEAIAERAGVSIGTLYQYFPGRDAIFVALENRRRRAIARLVREAKAGLASDRPAALRRLVRSLLDEAATNMGTRHQLALVDAMSKTDRARYPIEELTAVVATEWTRSGTVADMDEVRVRTFVLVSAIGGALRAASTAEPALLHDPLFEAAIGEIIRTLLKGAAN